MGQAYVPGHRKGYRAVSFAAIGADAFPGDWLHSGCVGNQRKLVPTSAEEFSSPLNTFRPASDRNKSHSANFLPKKDLMSSGLFLPVNEQADFFAKHIQDTQRNEARLRQSE